MWRPPRSRLPLLWHFKRSGQKFCGECGASLGQGAAAGKFASPETYMPKHLADKILTSKSALDGERKQVTVLFVELMMKTVHRYRHGKSRASCSRRTNTRTIEAKGYQP
jgi:hypothetical protein